MLPRRNVLIFHLGALGDFVLTWPLAVALGRLYPQSRIFYVTHGGKGKLAQQALGIDAIDVEAGWHSLYALGSTVPPEVERRMSSAHTIVSFVSDGSDAWATNVKRLAPEAALIFLQTPPRGSIAGGGHAVDFFQRQLQPYAALATATDQILRSVADRGIGGRLPAEGRVLIHPGSGSPGKCWPVEKFAEMARQLKSRGKKTAIVLGETEVEQWPTSILDKLTEAAEVLKPADLVALYGLIRSASTLIGNDSGPAHLAGIVGVPTVVIFGGAGDPVAWRPLGPRVKVIAAKELEAVSVEDVLIAIG